MAASPLLWLGPLAVPWSATVYVADNFITVITGAAAFSARTAGPVWVQRSPDRILNCFVRSTRQNCPVQSSGGRVVRRYLLVTSSQRRPRAVSWLRAGGSVVSTYRRALRCRGTHPTDRRLRRGHRKCDVWWWAHISDRKHWYSPSFIVLQSNVFHAADSMFRGTHYTPLLYAPCYMFHAPCSTFQAPYSIPIVTCSLLRTTCVMLHSNSRIHF